MRLYVAVIADGYLYGASRSAHASDSHYWLQLRLDGEPFTIYAVEVPEDIAANLEKAGTSEQIYSDGYDAMRVIPNGGTWEVCENFNGGCLAESMGL